MEQWLDIFFNDVAFFINKNYKINLHVTNSQTDTNLKPEFENDSQTHPRERRGESEETQHWPPTNGNPSSSRRRQ